MTAISSQSDQSTTYSTDPADYAYVDTAIGGVFNRNNVMPRDDFRPPPDASDCYATWYQFTEELDSYAATNRSRKTGRSPSVSGYPGACWAGIVYWDCDHQKDPGQARVDALTLVDRLIAFGIPSEAIGVYFSGKKGFGVEVDAGWLGGFVPGLDLPARVKRLALQLAEGLSTVDSKIYEKLRLLRLPNTKHGGTGLYKVPLTVDELRVLDLDSLRELAKAPRQLDFSQIETVPIP